MEWQCNKCLSVGFFDKTTRVNGTKSMTVYKCLNCGTIQEEVKPANESVIGEVLPNQNDKLID